MGQGAEDLDTAWARQCGPRTTMADILAEQAARPVLRPAKRKPSQVERIQALRDERRIGMHEVKRIVLREDLIADINAATNLGDIKALLLRVI